IRLRPILMTTAAMVVGLLPLLTASGAGAASRFSIGLVVVTGMSIGTLFTLFVLPAVYTVLGGNHRPAVTAARDAELEAVSWKENCPAPRPDGRDAGQFTAFERAPVSAASRNGGSGPTCDARSCG